MNITKVLTLEEIIDQESGALMLRVVKLRSEVEQLKQDKATLEMEIAKLQPRPEAPQ